MKIVKQTGAASLILMLAACGGANDAQTPTQDSGEVVEAAPDAAETPAASVDAANGAQTPEAQATPAPAPDAVETPESKSTPAPAKTQAPKVAAAPAATAQVPASFAMCKACHAVDPGEHGIGPSLAGVFGAKAGHADGFDYSDAMLSSGLTWNNATLNAYLLNPRKEVPGTKMSYGGMKDDAKRQAIIDYLKGL